MKLPHYFFTRTIISYLTDQGKITFRASSASKPNNNKACKMKETFVFDYIWTQSKITMFLTLVKIEWNEHPQKLTQIKFSKLITMKWRLISAIYGSDVSNYNKW